MEFLPTIPNPYPTSPMRRVIPKIPKIDPNSAAMIEAMLSRGNGLPVVNERAGRGGSWVNGKYVPNPDDYSHPVYFASEADPIYRVVQGVDGQWVNPDCAGTDGKGLPIHMPPYAKGAGGSDGSIAVCQPDGWEVSVWNVDAIGNGEIRCGFARRGLWTGNGLGNGWGTPPPIRGGITAAAFNLGMGLIGAQELVGNSIDHGLYIAINGYNGHRWPSQLTDPSKLSTGEVRDRPAPPMGAWLWLEPSGDDLSFAPWKRRILRAMGRHGLYVGDAGGAPWSVHLESEVPYVAAGKDLTNLEWLDRRFSHTGAWDLASGVDWHGRLHVLEPVQ